MLYSEVRLCHQFQENVTANRSRQQPAVTVSQAPAQPSQRTAVKLPAKSPTLQQKSFKSVELADSKSSEKVEEQSHEMKLESQPPALSSSQIVPPLVTSGSGVARAAPNHVKLSLASPTQARTAPSSMSNAVATPSGTQKVRPHLWCVFEISARACSLSYPCCSYEREREKIRLCDVSGRIVVLGI